MASKIYTKKGDHGKTSLIGGTIVPKSHLRIDSYGTIDELNSFIGLVCDLVGNDHLKKILKEVQYNLFCIGSMLACDPDAISKLKIPALTEENILQLEAEMDMMSTSLQPMKHFILPGGHQVVSTTHIARCVCRRAERICVNMQEQDLYIDPLIIKYINRLSDYLFILSRYIGHLMNVVEIEWKTGNN